MTTTRRRYPNESEFALLRYVISTAVTAPAAQQTAIAHDIRWADRRATLKRRYAVHSKARRPDYLPNVTGRGTCRTCSSSNHAPSAENLIIARMAHLRPQKRYTLAQVGRSTTDRLTSSVGQRRLAYR